MSVNSFSLVNQKLAYARALLGIVSTQDKADTGNERLLRQALLDAAVAHLVCAYQHYLRELAENYRVKQVALIKTEQDLINALGEMERASSEVGELLQLRGEVNGWFANLFHSYERQSALPLPAIKVVAVEMENPIPEAENLISLLDVDDEKPVSEASLRDVNFWHQQFVALIQRQRETSAEY